MGKMAKNFLYNSLYEVLVIVVPFILTPYLTRVLGKTSIGIFSYTNSIVLLFSTFGMLGMNLYSQREISYARTKNIQCLSKTFWQMIMLRLFLMVITFFIYGYMVKESEYKTYFIIQSLLLMYYFFDISWFFKGLEEMKFIALRNCAVKIVATILIFVFVRQAADLNMYIIINGGSMLMGALAIVPQLRKYLIRCECPFRGIRQHIVPIIKLFLPQAASSVYFLFDKAMIEWLVKDVVQVGFYDQSMTIAKLPVLFASSIAAVMLPRVSSEFASGHMDKVKEYISNAINILSMSVFPLTFGLIGISFTFIPWYLGAEFTKCVSILSLLALIIFPISMTNITGVVYLMSCNITSIMTVSYCTAGVVNLILNLLLIPRLGSYGAAIGTILAEYTVFFIQYYYMKTHLKNFRLLNSGYKSFFASVIMLLIIAPLGYMLGKTIFSSFIQIGVGAISYFLLMWIFKDRTAMNFYYLVKDTIKTN